MLYFSIFYLLDYMIGIFGQRRGGAVNKIIAIDYGELCLCSYLHNFLIVIDTADRS